MFGSAEFRRYSPVLRCVVWIGVLGCLALPVSAQSPERFDVLIRNGRLLDGTGNPWYFADVGIRDGRIVAVGSLRNATAARVIDATGRYVSPGFIDVHSHSAGGLARPELSGARQLLAQGVTTVMVNPDGGGPTDLVAQRAELSRNGLGVNVALLVPHNSLRGEVVGQDARDPTPQEMERMKAIVRAGMEAGAFGMSSGPYYAPSSFSKTEEFVELSKIVAEYGGVYTSHIRDESEKLFEAIDELIQVAEEAKLIGVVTHIKSAVEAAYGLSEGAIRRIERARTRGVQIFADQYPYEATSTSLAANVLPRWVVEGGRTRMLERLRNPDTLVRIRAAAVAGIARLGGADKMQFSRVSFDESLEGLTLAEAATKYGKPAEVVVTDMLERGNAQLVYFVMDEADIANFMRQPWVMTSSDGGLAAPGEGRPHPRYNGAFPRKIHRYVKERRVIDLAWAIRSMTSLPATVMHLTDRGVIRPGAIADVVVFDFDRVRDRATYLDPHQLAEGMETILVAGKLALDGGRWTDGKFGQVLSMTRR